MTTLSGMTFLQHIKEGNNASVYSVVQNGTVNMDERDEVGTLSNVISQYVSHMQPLSCRFLSAVHLCPVEILLTLSLHLNFGLPHKYL